VDLRIFVLGGGPEGRRGASGREEEARMGEEEWSAVVGWLPSGGGGGGGGRNSVAGWSRSGAIVCHNCNHWPAMSRMLAPQSHSGHSDSASNDRGRRRRDPELEPNGTKTETQASELHSVSLGFDSTRSRAHVPR
jgi:hypothetical protein